jgi:putative transposase
MNDQVHPKETDRVHQADHSVIEIVGQLLSEKGLSHMADAMRWMLHEALRIERAQVLEADPYQRTEKRKGYGNGFKPKTVSTRWGELALAVPPVRGEVEFYASALERGVRSQRALQCAIAEMHVQCAGRVPPQGDGGQARVVRSGGVQHAAEPRHEAAR